jgi:hypothetical protein
MQSWIEAEQFKGKPMVMNLARSVLGAISSLCAIALLAPIMILAFPFWVVSFLTRVTARLIQPTAVPWREIIEFDATIGWKPMANVNTYYLARGGDICHVLTDSHGWPGQTSLPESQVVVFGDSFAFGYGVNTSASYAEINPRLRVKAIGAPGYNMVQELLLMRELALHLRGKLVIWFICLENDLYDNLHPNKPNFYKTPFVRSLNGGEDWEIVTSHVTPDRWPVSLVESPYLPMLAKFCTPGFASQRAFAACHFLIREGYSLCKQAEAQLVVITIPNKNQLSQHGLRLLMRQLQDGEGFDPDLPDREIDTICRKHGIKFLAGKGYLDASDYKENDTHWNKQGNRRVAELIEHLYHDYLQEYLQEKVERTPRQSSLSTARESPRL